MPGGMKGCGHRGVPVEASRAMIPRSDSTTTVFEFPPACCAGLPVPYVHIGAPGARSRDDNVTSRGGRRLPGGASVVVGVPVGCVAVGDGAAIGDVVRESAAGSFALEFNPHSRAPLPTVATSTATTASRINSVLLFFPPGGGAAGDGAWPGQTLGWPVANGSLPPGGKLADPAPNGSWLGHGFWPPVGGKPCGGNVTEIRR